MLKRIFYAVTAALALLVLLALLLPSTFRVQRTVVINAEPARIFPYLNELRRWPEWVPWMRGKDPTLKIEYEGPGSGAGAIQRWEAKRLGKGSLKITSSDPAKGIRYEHKTEGDGFRLLGEVEMKPGPDGTWVSWVDSGDVGWNPAARYFNLGMDSLIGKDLEEGLRLLKEAVESKPAPNSSPAEAPAEKPAGPR